MSAEASVVQQIEAEIGTFVAMAQRRVLAAAGRLVRAHLAPLDPEEAEWFWSELQRGDMP